ncbi:hypothetical protein [Ferrovum myxofaciens]|uniref:hypothetical protein n=1 Tax=Ferrovum myxofaciens TaxID=416213 RepID=UPI0004E1BE80|nr:hypothetical protein [Ferrovum myxofaciens]
MLTADELFQELRGEAHKFSRCCILPVEDIRQELYLMCIEVTTGKSLYNPILGTVREYIMGRLWGLVRRWRESDPLPDEVEGDAMAPNYLRVQSVEQQLIDRLDREEREYALNGHGKSKPDKPQTSIHIVCNVLSRRDAAKFLGITREAVRQRVHREEKHLNRSQNTTYVEL